MAKTLLALLVLAFSLNTLSADHCYSYDNAEYGECLNLDGKSFEGKNLYRIDWIGASLVEANLKDTNLEMGFLSNADLSYATLEGANAYAIKLYQANLFKTNLKGANLNGATLIGADLSHAIVDEDTTFNGASIDSNTKLPLSWGSNPLATAIDKGMITIREVKEEEEDTNSDKFIADPCKYDPLDIVCQL